MSVGDRFGEFEAVVDGSLRLTFTELAYRIRCAAGAFAEIGLGKGDRVAVWAPNSAEWIIAAFGLMTAGGVLVPVNTRYRTEEAADFVTSGSPSARRPRPGVVVAGIVSVDDVSVLTAQLRVAADRSTSFGIRKSGLRCFGRFAGMCACASA